MGALLNWLNATKQSSERYTCGHCGAPLASELGYSAQVLNTPHTGAHIYICHFCTRPSFFDADGKQYPGHAFGGSVAGIPEKDKHVGDLYEEARRCTSAASYTGAVLCCRKLLMHIAVSKGAEAGGSFAEYVKYLSDHHYVPPDATGWVDHIRNKGNEANHDIVIMSKEEAEELVLFCEMLLKVIYEFPEAARRRTGVPTTP